MGKPTEDTPKHGRQVWLLKSRELSTGKTFVDSIRFERETVEALMKYCNTKHRNNNREPYYEWFVELGWRPDP